MLSTRGRLVRGAATVIVIGALSAGTLWGDDDHFPFGPFRMYSTTTRLSGTVKSPRLDVVTASGEALELSTRAFGLRPAEMLGQIRRFERNPGLLRHLATAYSRLHPEAPPLERVRLVFRVHRLEGGRPVETTTETVAAWEDR